MTDRTKKLRFCFLLASFTSACVEQAASPIAPSSTNEVPATARGPALKSPARPVERATLRVGEQLLSLHLPRGRRAPLPSVLVFPSSMGRTESVLESCDRLAEHGFAALAFDFYDGKLPSGVDEAKRLHAEANVRAPELRKLIEKAYLALEQDPRLRSSRRFLWGWSFGAAWATWSTSFLPDVQGVVAYYGEAFSEHDELNENAVPVLFVGAARDTGPTPQSLETLVSALRARGREASLVVVPAAHGFSERAHPGYDQAANEAAWPKAVAFLDRHVPALAPAHRE